MEVLKSSLRRDRKRKTPPPSVGRRKNDNADSAGIFQVLWSQGINEVQRSFALENESCHGGMADSLKSKVKPLTL